MAEAENRKKALIAMSGGVDSSVAAALMIEKGYECLGVTMKLYQNEQVQVSEDHSCCSLDDVEDARSVAYKLGMQFYVVNFTEDFVVQVIDRFVKAYEEGRTPNPCIDCNRHMKFERLYNRAKVLGCDYVVTGHYARTRYDAQSGRWQLLRALNKDKDQSYVLCFMTQEQIEHTIFPLGIYSDKEQIRAIAEEHGFINAKKHDSQDICFVKDGDYAAFIEAYAGKTYPPGDFVTADGKVLGRHKGIIHYTIGQRKGLGLALPAPLYVKEKNLVENKVVLTPESEIFSSELLADDFNWISQKAPAEGEIIRVTAKPRYRAKEAPASVQVLADGKVKVVFDEPQRAITSGQAVVLYQEDVVVGGGIIV